MSRLATTALGGLAALTALLVLRTQRKPAREPQEILVIHARPGLDTPQLARHDGPMVIAPFYN